GARVWGIDPSPEMLAEARAKGVRVKQASVEELPFKAGWLERAVLWLVAHLVDRPRAFAELRRVLRPDGRLAIVTFDAVHISDLGARVWGIDPSPEMLAEARAKGVRVKQASVEELPFKAGWLERAVLWLVAHLVDRPRAFAELRRVLRPDGRLAIVTFDAVHISDR